MLTLVDTRRRFGVWLAALTPDLGAERVGLAGGTYHSLLSPLRPRTATVRKDMFAVVRGIDERATRMLGWSAEQMVGVRSLEFCHPDDQQRAVRSWMQLASDKQNQRVRFRHQCQDGTWLWVECENTYVDAEDPDEVEVVAQLSDISDEMAAYEVVHQREKLFRRLAESLPIGLAQVSPEGCVTYANGRLARILGLPVGAMLGRRIEIGVEEDHTAVQAALDAALASGGDQELEISGPSC